MKCGLSCPSLILSFIAVPSHSIFSKPSDTFTVDVDASASAGAKSDDSQSPAVIGALWRPERPETKTAPDTESYTANEPSPIPTTSCAESATIA